jgi:hypothetical protein
MEVPRIIDADTALFDAIGEIVKHQFVLIQDDNNKISGIVTTSDLSMQFRQLTEPFLLLSEIENHIRDLIRRGNFSVSQLRDAADPDDHGRIVHDVFDLTFGDYIHLLEKPESWGKLKLPIDRKMFTDLLEKIRQIRNDVMHFDPDGVTEDDLGHLRRCATFLQRLQIIM